MNSNKNANFLLTLIGALLLWAAWPPAPFTFLIFIAWVPLLYLTENQTDWRRQFGYTYLHMLLWNVFTTWWVAKASVPGGLSAFLANSLVMCIPWMLYYFTRKVVGPLVSGLALITYWLGFEYLHLNWDLSWPWLHLGNVFATHPSWIQWYEYTGIAGGSCWILLSNILVFSVFMRYREEGRSPAYFKMAVAWVLTLCLPILFSLFIHPALTLKHNKYNVVVVQPNYDPWDVKFAAGKAEGQLLEMVQLSSQAIDSNTALVVWPETAVPFQVNEKALRTDLRLNPIWGLLQQHPAVDLLTGLEGYQPFDHRVSRYARKIESDLFVEGYNSAALMNADSIQIYHKSRLVPGPEALPRFLNFMGPLFEKFGGTMGGYVRDTIARVLKTSNQYFQVTPAICYESIYGGYLASFNRKGADLICVITNDGWWGKTAGYQQHMNYGRLRAIESRKWVARSANTGISCFIDPYGNVVQQLPWNQQGVLKQTIAAFVTETFYTRHGDWLYQIMSCLALAFILLLIYLKIKSKTIFNPKTP